MDDIFSKIFNMIDINKINTKDEFDFFIENLVNHPTPVREACAYKLEEFNLDDYLDEYSINIILSAITDINPNVSRCMCGVIKKNTKLQDILAEKILSKINSILFELSDEDKRQNTKSHAKNKKMFSLYWLMEALYYCKINEYCNQTVKIIKSAVNFSDYTIREKAAQLLSKIPNPPPELIEQIKKDSNFYVNFYAKFI